MSEIDLQKTITEHSKKIKDIRESMLVPLEIRMVAAIPDTILFFSLYLLLQFVSRTIVFYQSWLILLGILGVAIVFLITKILLRGVSITAFLFGIAMVDLESGYMPTRREVMMMIGKEFVKRLMLSKISVWFKFLESPYYRTHSMEEMGYVYAYRNQAKDLKYHYRKHREATKTLKQLKDQGI